jgi:putative MATE family efflux protein
MIDEAEKMGKEALRPLLIRFTIPVIVLMVAGSLYNLADRIFVGRGVGQDGLAGITVAFPFFILLYSIGLLFGIGAAALASLSLGRGDRGLAERAVGNALTASLATAVATIALGYIFLDPLLRAFGGEGSVLAEARTFSRIFLAGSLFQIVAEVLGSTIRSEGKPAISLAASISGFGINLVLNPLFIFAFKMGIAGSALATTIGGFVSCAWLLQHYARGKSLLRLRRSSLRLDPAVLRKITAIGFAPFISQFALCLMIAISNRAVASLGGTEAIACMGIIYVIYPLVIQPIVGISAGSQPILGYNYGAGSPARVVETLRLSTRAGTIACAAAWALLLVAGSPIVALFSRDARTIALGGRALRIFFAFLPLVGIQVIGSGYFQAVGKAGICLFNNLLRQLILIVPLLLILPGIFGLDGVWFSNPIADLAAAIVTGAFLAIELRRLNPAKLRRWG